MRFAGIASVVNYESFLASYFCPPDKQQTQCVLFFGVNGMIKVESKGNFDNVTKWLEKARKPVKREILNKYGEMGVEALRANTPVDTGKTADSWSYEIDIGRRRADLSFYNSNINNGVNIAIILQYGHGTKNGGYVRGRDYINPALRPVLDELANEAWKEVMKV